jgi:outer membrane immunogenic protein
MAAFSQFAVAADLPVKAPAKTAPVPVASYNWTGFYIGATAGYGWSNQGLILAGAVTFANPALSRSAQDAAASAASIPATLNTRARGFIGGIQLGYSFQMNQVVWGVEADFSGADIKGSDTQVATALAVAGISVTSTAIGDQRLSFLGTVRGRVGFTPADRSLVYLTGGLAYGQAKSSASVSQVMNGPSAGVTFPTSANGSYSSMRVGWTLGAGFEWAFDPRWSMKAEYLYYNLGSATYGMGSVASTNRTGTAFTAVAVTGTTSFNGSVARLGINYKL